MSTSGSGPWQGVAHSSDGNPFCPPHSSQGHLIFKPTSITSSHSHAHRHACRLCRLFPQVSHLWCPPSTTRSPRLTLKTPPHPSGNSHSLPGGRTRHKALYLWCPPWTKSPLTSHLRYRPPTHLPGNSHSPASRPSSGRRTSSSQRSPSSLLAPTAAVAADAAAADDDDAVPAGNA